MSIRFAEHDDIDYTKWDKCISNSLNGELFGFSWYLDTLFDQWGALIEDEYHAVMPLPYVSRILYREVKSHPLLKHTGIYSKAPVDGKKINSFINEIPDIFKKIHICFNRQNTQAFDRTSSLKETEMFELDLIIPYSKARRSYGNNIHESLDQARRMNMVIMKHISLSEVIKFLEHSRDKNQQRSIAASLQKILAHLLAASKAEILGVYGPENQLYAIACFVSSNNNVSLLYANTLSPVNEIGVNSLLLDSFLKSYSGRNVTLSLEHVDKLWNREFYLACGAQAGFKYYITENNMPFLFRWL